MAVILTESTEPVDLGNPRVYQSLADFTRMPLTDTQRDLLAAISSHEFRLIVSRNQLNNILLNTRAFLANAINRLELQGEGRQSRLLDRIGIDLTPGNTLIKEIKSNLDVVTEQLKKSITDGLTSTETFISGQTANIKNDLGARISGVQLSVGLVSSAIRAAISAATATTGRAIKSAKDSVLTGITSSQTGILQSLSSVSRNVQNSIAQRSSAASSELAAARNTITEAITGSSSEIKTSLSNIGTAIGDGISTGISKAATAIAGLGASLSSDLADHSKNFADAVKGYGDAIDNHVESVTARSEARFTLLKEQRDREYENTKGMLGFLKEQLEEGGALRHYIEAWSGTESAPAGIGADGILRSVLDSVAKISERDGQCVEYTTPFDPEQVYSDLLNIVQPSWNPLRLLMFAANTYGATSALAQLPLRNQQFQYAYTYPCIVPDIPYIIEMLRKKELTQTEALSYLRANGYNEERGKKIIGANKITIPLGMVMQAWLRKFIDDDGLDVLLDALGYQEESKELIQKLAFYIPPPSDLILMLVREVFNPQTVERFRQDEDYPEEFTGLAAQLGISEDWAHKYWQAHWRLPSAMQGFQMLHRGIIVKSDVELLLKSLDVMPFWRDRLIQLSYRPYTRVDVRRMHSVGVLNRSEVKKAYLDLGYNDERAENMTEFTERYNAGDTIEEATELEGLTRSTILRFYKQEIIDRDTVLRMLLDAGIGTQAAELYVTQIDLDKELKEHEDYIDMLNYRLEAGELVYDDLSRIMVSDSIDEPERRRILYELNVRRLKRAKLPPMDDLKTWFRAGILDDIGFKRYASAHGYSDFFLRLFLEEMEEGK